MINASLFHAQGYVIVENVFEPARIDWLRREILRRRHLLLPDSVAFPGKRDGGLTLPDFVSKPEFHFMRALPHEPALLRALHQVFGGANYRFCAHNDVGVDRFVPWHKDKLNGQYQRFQRLPLWSEEHDGHDGHDGHDRHFIVKAAIYLQDHADDDRALRLIPGSQRSPASPQRTLADGAARILRPPKGSVVIFEQRATHRGARSDDDDDDHHHHRQRGERILVSLGYGRRNAWTREFEEGTVHRQGNQSAMLRSWLQRKRPKQEG
jgi:hypothetical protein